MEGPFPPKAAAEMAGVPAGRFSVLRKKFRKDKDRSEWALMDSGGSRVLRWFGPEKPDEERVKKEERRVQYFKHKGSVSTASVRRLRQGELPSRKEFDVAFELEVPDGVYVVRGPRGWEGASFPVPDGEYGASEIWDFLKKAVSSGVPSHVYFAGGLLQTLGFEWS